MSETTESLRRKIDSAGDLQSVVRTMKALAAASIGQYEKSVRALADYYRTVELGDLLPAVARLGLHKHLPDEGGDGFNGIRHGEESRWAQAGIREARMNALANGPDADFLWHSAEHFHGVIRHHFVESPHELSLIHI